MNFPIRSLNGSACCSTCGRGQSLQSLANETQECRRCLNKRAEVVQQNSDLPVSNIQFTMEEKKEKTAKCRGGCGKYFSLATLSNPRMSCQACRNHYMEMRDFIVDDYEEDGDEEYIPSEEDEESDESSSEGEELEDEDGIVPNRFFSASVRANHNMLQYVE